jgi:hypothetical protein
MKWLRKLKRDTATAEANAALDGLVREGLVSSFETNFESQKASEPYRVTVIVDPGDYLKQERLWLQVRQALEPLGGGVEVRMEKIVSGSGNPEPSEVKACG